ncbi:phenylacetate--CoA ligase family protein [Geomonas sp. Red69]|uniref:phenylacetate--CoA ligase family protein n=1 Tax=Geomonas diazotrophica TaxID=2843197 RepID=UPI001C0F7358|nr:phenylacetate--CoA ligase family protein [Geomonas diazotrophica]MBU5638116.1 phenylacetate--CoA ligase family protein [Geomonas diazotrophica]
MSFMNFLRKNVFDPLYCHYTRSPRRSYWRELEKSQFLTEKELQDRQQEKLKRLVEFAGKENAFYSQRFEKAGFSTGRPWTLDDFKRIPVLTKKEIRENSARMISNGYDIDRLMHFKTGGSTGKSLDIYITEECSELRNACARRHDRWTGWEVGEPIAAVWGNPQLPTTLKERIKDTLLGPVIYLDTMCVNNASVTAFVREWEAVKPTLLFGHAHSIFLLARYLRQLKIEHLRPKGILSTSMMLLPHERQYIEDVFQVKVTDRYGCEEVSLIGCECEEHQGMHLNTDHLFVEFLKEDGTAAGGGEAGNLVITDLINYAMPFVRYRVEDVGVPSGRKCSCGRGFPLMEQVVGRTADFLVKPDGSRVAGISLIENTLTKYKGLDQMQIVQHSIDSFTVNLVTGHGYEPEVQKQLAEFLCNTFGNINIRFVELETIPPESSGKYRFSICEVRR